MEPNDLDPLISGNLSVEQALEQFILTRKIRGLSPKTIQFYSYELRHFMDFARAQSITEMTNVTPNLVRLWLQHMGETRNKGGVHASWRAIRALFLWYEDEMEPENWRNPIRKIQVPSPRPIPIPGITMADFRKLLDACGRGEFPTRDRAILYCLLDSCARAMEFLNLNIGDVNLVTGDVLIRAGKGGDPRYVQFASVARKELRKYLKTRAGLTAISPLFVTRFGDRFTFQGLNSLMRWRCKAAGIERPGMHDFRRAGALEMLRNGADISYLCRYLGHKSVEVTMRYLAITPDDLRETHRRTSPVDHAKF